MEARDLNRVVEIHCERFPNSRSTGFGRPFLRRMYKWFLAHEPELALVAVVSGRVEGFVVGSSGAYSKRVFRFALPQIIWGVIRRPGLMFARNTYKLWHSFLGGLFSARSSPKKAGPKQIHSASIGVSHRHPGLGIDLMEAFESAARGCGADLMACSIKATNVRVVRFCQKLGWQIRKQDSESVSMTKSLRDEPGPAADSEQK